MPLNLSEAIAGLLCGVLMHSASLVKELMICGTLLMTLGTGLYMNLDASSSIAKIAAFEVVGGLGCGLLFKPPPGKTIFPPILLQFSQLKESTLVLANVSIGQPEPSKTLRRTFASPSGPRRAVSKPWESWSM